MDEKCFRDLSAPQQTDICKQVSTVQKVTQDDMFKALASVNPTIDADNKITWVGFCLVTGYVMASGKLTSEQLHQLQRSCKANFYNYQKN